MQQVIIQLVQHLRPGGIETMALDLLRHCDRGQANRCYLVSLEGSATEALADWPRLQTFKHQLHFLEKPAGLSPNTLWRLAKLLRQLKVDAIHTHHIGPLFYGGLAARMAGVGNHVHTEHDAWHLNSKSNLRLQTRLINLLNPTLVADCQVVASTLREHFPSAQPQVINNGIDTRQFTPVHPELKYLMKAKLGLPEYGTLIGCAARLEVVKGHRYLLEALSRLHPRFFLALAGDGSLRPQLEAYAEQLGISQRVKFLGALDNMQAFYQAIDLFCLPSLNEGLPLSPLEAQACGVPVIVTDVGGCRDIVCRHSGTLVPSANARALAKAIASYQGRDERKEARAFVVKNANLDTTVAAYLSLLKVPGGAL